MLKARMWIGILCCILFVQLSEIVTAQNNDRNISILIRTNTNDSFSVKITSLKYDKDFAFSFTLDDGLASAYLVAYPFFEGGKVSDSYIDQWGYDQGGDGKYYAGLYYTDGCGNQLPFKAASAINAKSITTDTIFHPGNLSWKQVADLYRAGWDILSHGYSHETGKQVHAAYEVSENNRVVENRLKIKMSAFVIPGGKEDYLSEGPYTKAALDQGMQTVQCEHFRGHLIDLDSITIKKQGHLKLGREFLHSKSTTGKNEAYVSSGETIDDSALYAEKLVKEISTHLNQKEKFWINAFTHSVGNQNLWNISLVFPDFKAVFNQLENHYGENGMDNMWMAPTTEVYEYLLVSHFIKYHAEKQGKYIKITIDTAAIPAGLRYHEITFVLRSAGKIKKVKCVACNVESYSKEKKQSLVNVKWK